MPAIIAAPRWGRRRVPSDPLEALRRALADRYRIGDRLGEGGMADVYLADDLRHGRPVALKVLKPDISAGVGTDRFLGEIRLTARLRHPGILPLFDSGEAGGALYYVMPLVEGETLADRLEREPQLPLDEAVRIVGEVAEALAYAHERGIVHRDIKPGNILLESGRAVVADFGIARALGGAGGAGGSGSDGSGAATSPARPGTAAAEGRAPGPGVRNGNADAGRLHLTPLTEIGAAIGSPRYMSPEQATGRPDIDARSDVYSLGCVTYEMLAGQPPFTGPTPLVVMARHALDPVPPLATARPGIPPRAVAAIERALAKAPADRFPSVTAFAEALRAASRPTLLLPGPAERATPPAGLPAAKPAIAVLPFEDLCDDCEQAFYAAGMHDAVIAELGKIAALRVISRTTMSRYQGTRETISRIAEELGASAVMEGSVLRSGGRVRISLRLIRGTDEAPLWSETYERDLSDVLALHAEVARAVAEAVHARLTAEERVRLAGASPIDPKVYELYLRGRHQSALIPAEAHRAVHYFEQAIALAPDFAPAHSGLARRLTWLASLGFEAAPDALPRAMEAAARAQELDPESADALAALGYLRFVVDWDPGGAGELLERALALEPGNLDAHLDYAFLLCATGQFEEAERVVDRMAELDPLSPPTALHRGWFLFMSRRFDEAAEHLAAAAERYPWFAYLQVFGGLAEAMRGERERAAALARSADAAGLQGRSLDFLSGLATLFAYAGLEDDARRVIAQLESLVEGEEAAWFRWMARLVLGDEAEAVRWFDLAFEQRNPMLVLLPYHPIVERARRHPHMRERIVAMGLVERLPEPIELP